MLDRLAICREVFFTSTDKARAQRAFDLVAKMMEARINRAARRRYDALHPPLDAA